MWGLRAVPAGGRGTGEQVNALQELLYWLWPWLRPLPVPPYEPHAVRLELTRDGREVILVRRAAIDPEEAA